MTFAKIISLQEFTVNKLTKRAFPKFDCNIKYTHDYHIFMQIRFQGRFIIWRTIILKTILENKDLKSYLTLDTKGTSVGDPAPFFTGS